MEITSNINNSAFELRSYQILIGEALELRKVDFLKENKDIQLSKADLILIYTIFENGLEDFYDEYKKYLSDCVEKKFRAVDKPHWYLKRMLN